MDIKVGKFWIFEPLPCDNLDKAITDDAAHAAMHSRPRISGGICESKRQPYFKRHAYLKKQDEDNHI